MKKKYLNRIHGRSVPPKSKRFFENRNPADIREVIGLFPGSGQEDVDAAVSSARKAYESWRLVPAPKRGDMILRAGLLLEKHKKELAQLMTREMGKVLKETLGDVQEAIDMAFYIAGEGRRLFGRTTPSELRSKSVMSLRVPVGVCGLITPWNFPAAIPAWKTFPALICGNTIVFKPAEDTPASAARFVEILEKAGLPAGVMNLVHGGADTGQALVRHPDVDLISFTGSGEVGREVAEVCGRSLKRCSLEMGGKNAQIVLEDADLSLALEGAVWGAFGTTGQRCTATSRIFVQKEVFDAFRKALVDKAKKIKIGNGLKAGVEMGPLINESQLERVDAYTRLGVEEGAKMECGGKRIVEKKFRHGFFYKPTIFTGVHPSMKIMREEIFGPVTCLMPVKDLDEALRHVNESVYGLSSSIYTRDVNAAMRAIRDIEAGITYINGPTIGAEVHMPFGGVKNTGNGHREAGDVGIDVFSEWKSVYIDYSGRLQKAQIDVE